MDKENKKIDRLLDEVKQMQVGYMSDVLISPRNYFNQYLTVMLIELYTHSKYADISTKEAEELGIVFQNITTQALKNAIRRTNIDEKTFVLDVKDKIMYYLANAGMKEFFDDEEFGSKLNEIIKQYYKFGTVVMAVDKFAKKGERFTVIPFNKII